MTDFKEFALKNFRTIIIIGSFIITMYVQHLNNTEQVRELKERTIILDEKIKDQYEKIDAIKLDKAVFEATMQQVTAIKTDINEIRSDIKELLKAKR